MKKSNSTTTLRRKSAQPCAARLIRLVFTRGCCGLMLVIFLNGAPETMNLGTGKLLFRCLELLLSTRSRDPATSALGQSILSLRFRLCRLLRHPEKLVWQSGAGQLHQPPPVWLGVGVSNSNSICILGMCPLPDIQKSGFLQRRQPHTEFHQFHK
jgi:hypothetical protein